MNSLLNKEVCEPCGKFINIGQTLLECENCHIIVHARCHKTAKFQCINEMWVCSSCEENIEPRYNPFKSTINSDETDKFYDDEGAYDDSTLLAMSNILDNCAIYKKAEFSGVIEQLKSSNNSNTPCTTASTLFINIDGNKTNFDHFLAELLTINHTFSAIGLAETNTDDPLSNLYLIDNYNSHYQNTIENKHKGSGVAIYIHNSLNTERVEQLCYVTPDIESLFVKTTNTPITMFFGVIYRPPNGNINKFIYIFNDISASEILPKQGVHIMGDYNIDLLNGKCDKSYKFE